MAIELSNPEGWQASMDANPRDPDGEHNYGSAVNAFAERWAELMQDALAKGETFDQMARRCEREADDSLGKWSGITGFQYGCAVSLLAQCWKYGDELRRWHNLATQLGNEGEKANESGGTLNPAIMTVQMGEE